MSENGQEVQERDDALRTSPQDVINELLNRIANMTMELAIKDAYIVKLEADRATDQRLA